MCKISNGLRSIVPANSTNLLRETQKINRRVLIPKFEDLICVSIPDANDHKAQGTYISRIFLSVTLDGLDLSQWEAAIEIPTPLLPSRKSSMLERRLRITTNGTSQPPSCTPCHHPTNRTQAFQKAKFKLRFIRKASLHVKSVRHGFSNCAESLAWPIK